MLYNYICIIKCIYIVLASPAVSRVSGSSIIITCICIYSDYIHIYIYIITSIYVCVCKN